METKKIDVLFIGAHQDDVDATVGGTVALLVEKGYKVQVLDLVERKGMYFSDEEAWGQEAEHAARILGIERFCLKLSTQNKLENTFDNRFKIADFIRSRQPDVVFTLNKDETHPDHNVAHNLVLDALHISFATAIKTDYAPWRVKGIYFFPTNILFEPLSGNYSFIDISSTFEKKMEALKSYASQMLFHAHNRKYGLEYTEALNRSWGLLIGKEHAEAIIPRVSVIDSFPELKK
jgi:N-acetylglucosamine malate deacetylase 1